MKSTGDSEVLGDHLLLSRPSLLKVSVLLLVLVPLWPQLGHAESEFLGRSLILMLAFVTLAMTPGARWRAVRHNPLGSPMAALGLVALAATVLARYPHGAKADLAVVLLTLLVFLVVSLIDPNEEERRHFFGGLVVGAGILAGWALWVQMQGPEEALRFLRQQTMEPEFRRELERSLKANRAMARFGNPNHLAAYLALTLPAGWHLLWKDSRALWRVLWGSLLLLILLGIVQTRSRAGVGVALIVMVVMALQGLPHIWARFSDRRRRLFLIVVAVLAIPAASIVMLKAPSLLGGRLMESKTILARLYYYRAAAHLMVQHVWGVGLDGYSTNVTTVMRPGDAEANEAHNLILDAAVEMGPVGVFVLLWILIAAWRRSAKAESTRHVAGLMLAAFVLVSLVDFESELGEFAVLFGLFLGLISAPGTGRSWKEPPWRPRRQLGFVCLFGVMALVWWSLVLGPYMSRLYQEVAAAKRQLARDAVPALERAYAWQSRDAKLMNTLGKELRFRQRTRTEALYGLELLERAATANPDRAFLHGDLAQHYLQEKRFEEALTSVDRAIERFPARLDYHVTRQECLTQAGLPEEAEAERRRIEQLQQEAEERRL